MQLSFNQNIMSLMIVLVISGAHIVILVIALVLLFGGKKIPELMSGIGKGMKDFKKAIKEDDVVSNDSKDETSKEMPTPNKKEPLK